MPSFLRAAPFASALALALAAPLACGAFGAEYEPPKDAGLEADAAANAPEVDSSGADGNADLPLDIEGGSDAGLVICDDFDRADVLGDGSLWGSIGPSTGPKGPPYIEAGRMRFPVESSSSTWLQGKPRERGQTIRYRAKVVVHASAPEWDASTFSGWTRLVDVDSSIDVPNAEFLGLDVQGLMWRVAYRTFNVGASAGAQQNRVAPDPLIVDQEHEFVVEERFSTPGGYLRVWLDGELAVDLVGQNTAAAVEKSTWQVRIGGGNNGGPTPTIAVEFESFCLGL